MAALSAGACILLTAAVLAAGCASGADDPRSSREACSTAAGRQVGAAAGSASAAGDGAYSRLPVVAGYDDPLCNVQDEALAGAHRLRLFRQTGLDAHDLAEGLQRYYRRYGLELSASTTPIEVDLPYLLDNDRAGLDRALRCAFPGIDPTAGNHSTAVESFALDHILRPVRAFLEQWTGGGPQATDLVAVERIFREADEGGQTTAGLAVSLPYLAALRGSAGPEAEVWRDVHLPASFNATVFVIVPSAPSSEAPGVVQDLTVAHELAHTAGLPHSPLPANLMAPDLGPLAATCRWGLEPGQLAAIRDALLAPRTLTRVTEPTAGRVIGGDRSFAPAAGGARRALRRWLRGDRRAFSDLARTMFHGGP